MLANIDSELSTIQNGRYGEDIRTAIKDAISKVNNAGYMPVVENLNVVENGTYTPSAGVNGFSKVVVNVPGGGGGYPEPTGTISITENGTVNVKDYASANVNVQPNLQNKTATHNGTVTADSGYDGLSSVLVNVQSGGSGNIGYGTAIPDASTGADGDIYLRISEAAIKNSSGQYINTGYHGNSNSKYYICFMMDTAQTAQYSTPFGARSAAGSVTNASYVHMSNGSSRNVMLPAWGSNQYSAFDFGDGSMTGKLVEMSLEAGMLWISMDGTEYTYTFTPTNITDTTPIGILTLLIGGNVPSFSTGLINTRLYAFDIYESDVLVHSYRPAKDGSDVVCLYDSIEQQYVYHSGGGTLQYIEGGLIINTFLKVNGVWQNLYGSDIDDVDTSGLISLQEKTVTQNGTVTPDAGYDGLSSVFVNVQGGGSGNISYGTGDPVSSTGSNGDVYFKYERISAGSSLLPDGDDDLDNWEKSAAAFTQFDNTCVNGENTLIQTGGSGYERIFVSVSVDSNTDYVFSMKYYSPSGVASGYGGQICFGVSFTSESSMRSSSSVTLDNSVNLSLTAESDYSDYSVSFNSGNHTSAYLVINLNILDDRQCTLKFKDIEFYKAGEPPVYVDTDIIRSAYLKQNGTWVNAIGAIIE